MSIFKELIGWTPDNKMNPTHEEIPEEELWEDGELRARQIGEKLFARIIVSGEWKIIRRIDG